MELLTILTLDITKTMASYEYHCYSCGMTIDVERSMNEDALNPICCGESTARVWSATSAIFKGNGWYKNDNR